MYCACDYWSQGRRCTACSRSVNFVNGCVAGPHLPPRRWLKHTHLSTVNEDVAPAGQLDIIGIGCDVSQSQSIKDAFDIAVNRWGKIDAVVAAAGIAEKSTALDYPEERFKRMFEINTQGVFYTAREGARCMIEKGNGGSIILVSSMSAGVRWRGLTHPRGIAEVLLGHVIDCQHSSGIFRLFYPVLLVINTFG